MSATALRNLVIGLGLLILLAFAAVVWGIVGASGPDGNGRMSDPAAEIAREISLGLPAGCEIVGAQTAGNTLTIVTGGPSSLRADCTRVFLVDLVSGAVVSRVSP